MRISPPMTPSVERTKTEAASAPAQSEAPATPGAVVLDTRARETSAASERSSAAHAARLSELADALASGRYKVDHQLLAQKIVADEVARRSSS